MRNVIEILLRVKETGAETLRRSRRDLLSLGKVGRTALSDLHRASRQYHESLQRINGTVRGLRESLGGLAAAFGGFSLARAFIGTAAEWETYRAQLETAYGSLQRAEAISRDIQAFAAKTPFQVGELTEAWIKLKNMGLDPTVETLRTLGDTAAALGGGREVFQGIILALGQMQAKGKASAEELIQLAERGVPVFEILKEKLHLTGKEVQDIGRQAVSSQRVIDALLEGMAERYGGAMERMSGQLKGLWSTILDNFKQFQAAVMESGVAEFLKEQMREVLQAFQGDAMDAAAQKISDALVRAGEAIRSLVGFFAGLASALRPLLEILLAVGPAALELWVKFKVLKTVLSALVGLPLALGRELLALKEAFLATSIGGFAAELQAASVQAGVLNAALVSLRATLLTLAGAAGAFFAGWQIGRFISEIKIGSHSIGEYVQAAIGHLMKLYARARYYFKVIKGFMTFRDVREEAKRELEAELRALDRTIDGILAGERKKQQAKGTSLDAIREEMRLEREKAQTARQIEQERIRLTTELQKAQSELANLQKERTRAARKALQDEIAGQRELLSALRQRIQETQRALSESLRKEEEYAERIRDLERGIKDARASTEEKVRAIRRRGMSEEELEADKRKELAERLSRAWMLLRKGQIEAAAQMARKAQDVAAGLKDEEEAVRGVEDAGRLLIRIQKEQKERAEEALRAQKERSEDLRSELEELNEQQARYNKKIDELTRKLRELSERRAAPEIDADIDKARSKIDEIKGELARLDGKTVEAVVRIRREEARAGGGLIGRLARGGRIPGWGGGDRVRALLEPGEFVIRKEAVRRYGAGLFELLNSLRLNLPRIPAPAVPRMQPAFQSGGLVANAPLLGRLELAFPGGESIQVFAFDREIKRLEKVLNRANKTR